MWSALASACGLVVVVAVVVEVVEVGMGMEHTGRGCSLGMAIRGSDDGCTSLVVVVVVVVAAVVVVEDVA